MCRYLEYTCWLTSLLLLSWLLPSDRRKRPLAHECYIKTMTHIYNNIYTCIYDMYIYRVLTVYLPGHLANALLALAVELQKDVYLYEVLGV